MSQKQIWIRHVGKVYGPYDPVTVKSMAEAGTLHKSMEISQNQMNWHTAGNVNGLFSSHREAPTANPALMPRPIPPKEPAPGDSDAEAGSDISCSFVTSELNFFQKMMQVYWVNPGSWLLARLDVAGNQITIHRRNGAVDRIRNGAFQCTFGTDKYGRREFSIQTTDQRNIRFKEIPGMLSDSEWDAVAGLLGATESNWNKLLHAAHKLLKFEQHHH
jgi:hypothetical protein